MSILFLSSGRIIKSPIFYPPTHRNKKKIRMQRSINTRIILGRSKRYSFVKKCTVFVAGLISRKTTERCAMSFVCGLIKGNAYPDLWTVGNGFASRRVSIAIVYFVLIRVHLVTSSFPILL